MEENMVALKVLIAAAKAQPDKAPALWQAARILLKTPITKDQFAVIAPEEEKTEKKTQNDFPAIRAEFDYADENGLCSHRTVWVLAFTDGRDIKRNSHLPIADRYGYLLTGYCTLRQQIRSFRSSRISNFRTFIEGEPHQPNRQWRPKIEQVAV